MRWFARRITVEDAVAATLTLVPRWIELVREEKGGLPALPDSTIANIGAAMYLFYLNDVLSFELDKNKVPKMGRAFDAMWRLIPRAGGDEQGARAWFHEFNDGLLDASEPLDRIAIVTKGIRRHLALPIDADCALDILANGISATTQGSRNFRFV